MVENSPSKFKTARHLWHRFGWPTYSWIITQFQNKIIIINVFHDNHDLSTLVWVSKRLQKSYLLIAMIWYLSRENLYIYGPYRFHLGHFAFKTSTLCFLWGTTCYSYVRALDPSFLEATDISALFSTNHNFAYMLSWIVLFEKFVPLRVNIYNIYDNIFTFTLWPCDKMYWRVLKDIWL